MRHELSMNFLIFDASDDGHGHGTWEAMASVQAERLPQLMAEVHAALALAERRAPGPRGPMEEGGAWDAELQVQAQDSQGWTCVTLSLTGPWAWGEALVAELSAGG